MKRLLKKNPAQPVLRFKVPSPTWHRVALLPWLLTTTWWSDIGQISFFFFFWFLGPHMEGPRLRVESELQLSVTATATATPDLSQVCNLHHSSLQHWIPNPLREARDQTCILVDTSRIHFRCTMTGIPLGKFLNCYVSIASYTKSG